MSDRRYKPNARLPITVEDGITLSQLISQIEGVRGRPLRIVEVPQLADEGALCGLWMATADADIILHAPSESELHRQQFVLHELAHMILGHDQVDQATPENLLPELGYATAKKVLARDTMSMELELAAEALADDLAAAMRTRPRPQSPFLDVFG